LFAYKKKRTNLSARNQAPMAAPAVEIT
jgi:hypothetical protein